MYIDIQIYDCSNPNQPKTTTKTLGPFKEIKISGYGAGVLSADGTKIAMYNRDGSYWMDYKNLKDFERIQGYTIRN